MLALQPAADVDRFFADLAQAPERVLMLDYDGTLAPFHARPERAVPYPGVGEALAGILSDGATRLVLVSGRTLEDLRRVLGFLRGAEAWGIHGWQHRAADGARTDFDPGAAARERLRLAAERARPLLAFGVRLERKNAALAAHWRGLGEVAVREARALAPALWRALAGEALELMEFDGGLELRARGRNKGDVVREVLGRGSAAAAYLGDDATDEDAFAAIRGRGLGVLVGPRPRASAAGLWIAPPGELVEFLRRWRRAARGAA